MTQAPTGSYVDRSRVDRSSEESYDPGREGELWEAAEQFTSVDGAGTEWPTCSSETTP